MIGNHQSVTLQYEEAATRRWLSWIAKQMQKHGNSVLRVEQLQPTWLVKRHEHVVYVMITRMIAGLLVGVVAASLDMSLSLALPEGAAHQIAVAFWYPLGWGLVAGIATGIGRLLSLETRLRRALGLSSDIACYLVCSVLGTLIALAGLLFYMAFSSTCFGHAYAEEEWVLVVMIAVVTGLLGMRSVGRNLNADIQSTETLGWSTEACVPGLISGTLVSFCLICFYVFYISSMATSDPLAWIRVVVVTLVGTIVGSCFHGFRSTAKLIDPKPNQGILLSGKHSIVAGVMLGMVAGVAWGCCIGIQESDARLGIRLFFFGFLANYLVAGFWFGGLDVMRHCVLRILLWGFGYMPIRLVPFLEFVSSKLNFLKRDGGGYEFIHRYLQEHFANSKVS